MATTYPLATLAAQITPSGVVYPSYSDTLLSLQASYQLIYGSDAYLAEDSQDGQYLAIQAQLIYDANQAVEAAYLNMSPATALGNGLSSAVKINGLKRNVSSNSQATMLLSGAVGTVITNGKVADAQGNVWDLPATVTIGSGGTVVTTATCETAGSISAAIGTITTIRTPTYGWTSASNTAAASLGAPVEEDPALRARQASSTALPSLSILNGVTAAILAVTGVTEAIVYENDTGATDSRGLPQHSLSAVVRGGADADVAAVVNLKKGPGASTYGNTAVTVTDVSGLPKTINIMRPVLVPIAVTVYITALSGYASPTGAALRQSVVDYITALATGTPGYIARLYLPAQLYGDVTKGFGTYEVTNITQAIKPAAQTTGDIAITFSQRMTLALADVTLIVT